MSLPLTTLTTARLGERLEHQPSGTGEHDTVVVLPTRRASYED